MSRHAESLFWIGRYLERAAYVTRMLDVASNRQLEQSTRTAAEVWHDVLRVLYVEDEFAEHHGTDASTGAINRFLVLDRSNPGSVAASVREARTNVMNVRDIVPIELLETVNQLHAILTNGSLDRYAEHSPHEIYQKVSQACRSVSGAIEDSMVRDDTFRFLILGRLLERAEMTCRMIDVNRTVAGREISAWMSVLRSVSGYHGFTQRRSPLAPVDAVVRYMLREPDFPFAVMYCLRIASRLAAEVAGSGVWESARRLGMLTADLEHAPIPTVDDPALEDLLERIEDGIRLASEALHQDLYQFGGEPLLHTFEAP